jgi:hypothetical protein
LEAIDPEAELSRLRELARLGRELTRRDAVAESPETMATAPLARTAGATAALIGQKNEPALP